MVFPWNIYINRDRINEKRASKALIVVSTWLYICSTGEEEVLPMQCCKIDRKY